MMAAFKVERGKFHNCTMTTRCAWQNKSDGDEPERKAVVMRSVGDVRKPR